MVRRAISDALKSLYPQASTRKCLSKSGNTILTHCELSTQEASYRLSLAFEATIERLASC